MFDKKGRPYVCVDEVTVGTKLEFDDGFSCIKKGAILTVKSDGRGLYHLYVDCAQGRHYINAHLDHATHGHYVGIYLPETKGLP